MQVRQTPSRLVLHHRPRFAAIVAVILWAVAAAGGIAVNLLWPHGPLLSTVAWVVLLSMAGLLVLLTEPRAKTWIFDREVQEIRVLRRGWGGSLRPEAAIALGEIRDVLGSEAGRGAEAPALRLRGGRTQRLFDNDLRWASDRRRALRAVRAFLEAARTDGRHSPAPASHYFGPPTSGLQDRAA